MSLDPGKNFGSNELEWVAFCYVSDELSESERIDFEDRLGEEQACRDAVVRVMELNELTYGCFDTPATSPRAVTASVDFELNPGAGAAVKRPAPGLLFAAAACVAMIALGWSWQVASYELGDTVGNTTRDVADAWSGLDDWESSDRLAQQFSVEELTDGKLASSYGELYFSEVEAESVDWMLVALMDIENQQGGQAQ